MMKQHIASNYYQESIGDRRISRIVAMLYANAREAVIGSLVNTVIVALVLMKAFSPEALFVWLFSAFLITVSRLVVHQHYMTNPSCCSARAWLNVHRLLTCFSGCMYGLLAIYFFSSGEPAYQALVIFLVGGMAAAAVGTHGVDITTYGLFLITSVFPLIVRVLYEDAQIYTALALMLGMLMVVMMRAARQTGRIMLENIVLSDSLVYRATHDPLVGLLNREEFENFFNRRISTHRISAALIFIDLDNFKTLNDTAGHQAGDRALVAIGKIIRASIRREDIAARMGGDEFMVLLASATLDQAQIVAEKIRRKISDAQAWEAANVPRVGASIGIGYVRNQCVTYADLLAAADQACYQAKNTGKGRICARRAATGRHPEAAIPNEKIPVCRM